MPFTVLGGALLWFGWFGFNAGSALGANELAAHAFITTNTATAAAGLTWALIEWKHNGTPTALGAVTGAVAGLVAITPACGFVSPINAIFIGILGSFFCYLAVTKLKALFGYDDSLDVFGIHGVGGIWGTLATGLFAEKVVNEAGANGLFFGGAHQFLVQCLLVVVTVIFAAAMTWIIFKLVDAIIGVRVDKKSEIVGLDLTQHSESAYTLIE
jgi:Amt family ammonium transporter